uniref:Uncharacterized protein n=1 Tax=Rhizophagus irregularis (strain DAOM 181602 / DAOM 197198 / MUCL 43194) TaxID=747089 RepID=U9UIF8_RHIID
MMQGIISEVNHLASLIRSQHNLVHFELFDIPETELKFNKCICNRNIFYNNKYNKIDIFDEEKNYEEGLWLPNLKYLQVDYIDENESQAIQTGTHNPNTVDEGTATRETSFPDTTMDRAKFYSNRWYTYPNTVDEGTATRETSFPDTTMDSAKFYSNRCCLTFLTTSILVGFIVGGIVGRLSICEFDCRYVKSGLKSVVLAVDELIELDPELCLLLTISIHPIGQQCNISRYDRRHARIAITKSCLLLKHYHLSSLNDTE